MKRLILSLSLAVGFLAAVAQFATASRQDQLQDDPVIGYRSAGSNDAVAELQRRISSGEL